ncbi:fam-d protein [Plasmodium vinckei]|uniref:Fam-d protein n=1 Tax=Plasmodium vinckei TaxID=5860 RepID=A0A6V7SWY0_PLAVN|nr:fam-d protein [Plasmodium vinckei]
MKMMNIILSFFIFVISANVKAATFQDANNSSPRSIGFISVDQPIVTFPKCNQDLIRYLDKINYTLFEQSENMRYGYEGGKYHWIVADFVISIDNSSPYLNKSISKNRIEELQTGTRYFITYIKESIKYFVLQHMHKYNFENNYDDNLNIFANDLKTSMYEQFDAKFEKDLIKYENEPKNKKVRNRAKKTFNALVQNSEINIRGYFIKISKDGNYTHLSQNKSLYFEIIISKDDTNVTHDFKIPIPNIVKLVSNISVKS